jgi:hypothetical protein
MAKLSERLKDGRNFPESQARAILFANIMTKTPLVLVPPAALAQLPCANLSHYFSGRMIRKLQRSLDDIDFRSLRHQDHIVTNTPRNDNDAEISDAELGTDWGHWGEWEQEMVARCLHELISGKPIADGRPKLVESDIEKKSIRFCLVRQFSEN